MLSQKDKLYAEICSEKKRSSNFSPKEVKFLLQLVDNQKEVIESKKTDRTTSEKKIFAWLEIENDFNAAFEDCRSFKVLKTKYHNLKKKYVKRSKLPANEINAFYMLKMMQANDTTAIEISDDNYSATTDDEDTFNNSNGSNSDIKPHPPLNEHKLDAAGILQSNSSKQHLCQRQQEPNIKRPSADIWKEVAHKKLEKLELQINAIKEEHQLRKRKLELEIESIEIENSFQKEKYNLELKVILKKFQNKSDT